MPRDFPVKDPITPPTPTTFRFDGSSVVIKDVKVLNSNGDIINFDRVEINHLDGDRFAVNGKTMQLTQAQIDYLLDVAETIFRTAQKIV